jgi:hypothetical protein
MKTLVQIQLRTYPQLFGFAFCRDLAMRSFGARLRRRINVFQLAFTIAYTLVVLPFTVQFVSHIAKAPNEPKIFGISIGAGYMYFLPVFLGFLEFVSVTLAVAFWRERKFAILGVFFLCQLYAVTATYFSVRASDYRSLQTQLSAHQQRESILASNDRSDLEQFIERRRASQASLTEQLQSIEAQIARDELRYTELTKLDRDSILAPQVREINSLQAGLESSRDQRDKWRAQLLAVADTTSQPPLRRTVPASPPHRDAGEFGFIVKNFATSNSFFALFIALLFPIAVIGAGYVFSERDGSELRSQNALGFDLTNAIEIGSRLPSQKQQQFARSLQASVAAYFLARRTSQDLAIATSVFHLENEREISAVEESLLMREEIRNSDLDISAKDVLMKLFEEIAQSTARQPQTEGLNDGWSEAADD